MDQTAAPGTLLAGRYRLDALLGEVDEAQAWRAVDEVLGRNVVVHALSVDDPRAEHVAAAARAAAAVRDPRFLRVLDAAVAGHTVYVVREWVQGRNLGALLADGPLASATAGQLAREVAEAVTAAHTEGLCHLHLDPTTVIVADDGAVKVTGLATEAAFLGTDCADEAAEDALGIGRVLYAGLTGRWPGADGGGDPSAAGLAAAPYVDGRLASPRQVRNGVPRELDELADRILGDPPRHGRPLRTPSDVAAALALAAPNGGRYGTPHLLDLPGRSHEDRPSLLPLGTDPEEAPGHEAAAAPARPARRAPGPAGERRVGRVIGVVAGLLLLLGTALVGWQLLTAALPSLGGSGDDASPSAGAPGETTATPSAPAGGRPLAVTAASDFDPAGDGAENPDDAPAAFDGDPATAWRTQTYFDPLEAQKDGVGLVLDLGNVRSVGSARLTLDPAGGDLELRAAPAEGEAPEALADWRRVAMRADATGEVLLSLDDPVRTRYLLVWFTVLPQVGDGEWRGGVAEVKVSS